MLSSLHTSEGDRCLVPTHIFEMKVLHATPQSPQVPKLIIADAPPSVRTRSPNYRSIRHDQ